MTPLESAIASATELINAVLEGRVWVDVTQNRYSSTRPPDAYRIKVDKRPDSDF